MLNPFPVKMKVQLPRRSKGLLCRPRLVNFLHENIDRKLVVISAAAGYGKTSLLLDYAYEAEIPVCWYSLDQFDREPKVFLEHFIASIRHRFPFFGEKSLVILRNLRDLSNEIYPLVSTLANEIYDDIPEYFTIILDDYHFVDENDLISDFLGYFLQYTDEHCHLIVASRTLPGIPNQALLSARNQMAGLSTDELRFTAGEIQALIKQNYDLDIPDDKAEELALHFEGWITGILLTAQTMWEKLIEGVIEARGPGGGVYDFLAEQVFIQQSPELRRFLLGTSILDELNPELCDILLEIDDSGRMLELAQKRNLFLVELEEDEGRWFRYHHLFQKFLQDRLRQENKTRYSELHLKAAGIYERERQWDRAVDHYLRLGLYQEVARVVEKTGREMFELGRLEALVGWIDALPKEVLRSGGRLLLLRGMVYLERGNYVLAMKLWEEAQQEFSRTGDKTNMARTLERKGTALRFQGRFQEAIALCREALALVGGRGEEKAAPADAYRTIGICYHRLGRLGQAIEHLERSLQLYEQTGRGARIASLHHDLGVVYAEAGQLAESESHFQAALRYWEEISNPEPWAHTLNSIGMNHYRRGEYDRALRFFNKALAKAREAGNPRTQAFVLASLADLYRDSGDYERALQMYGEALEAADQVDEGWAITYVQNARGETYRLMGAYGEARRSIELARQGAERRQSDYELGRCHISLGILSYERGDLKGAEEHLSRAWELFQRSGEKQELARARFHLAQVCFLGHRYEEVKEHLQAVAELVDQLGCDHFLVVDGRRTRPLLQYSVSEYIGQRRFDLILQKVDQPVSVPSPKEVRAPVAPSPLQIFALGKDRILRVDTELAPQWTTLRELFFYLLSHHPQGVRKEQLLDVFWRDAPTHKAKGAFKTAIYRLRRFICPVIEDNGWYSLDLPPGYRYDVEEFDKLLDEESLAEDGEKASRYWQAIALYQGDYLEQTESDWCLVERERLRYKYIAALMALADLYFEQREYNRSLELYRRVLVEDGYHEAACQGLMRCYNLIGNRALAIQCYHEFARLLREELGLDPMPETEELYLQILEAEPGP